MNGLDELSHPSSEEPSFERVHQLSLRHQISDGIYDHRHGQLVRTDGAHTIAQCLVGPPHCSPPTRGIPTGCTLRHHLDDIRKAVDLRLFVFPALQAVTFPVRRLPALLGAPATRSAPLLWWHSRTTPLTQPRPARPIGFFVITHRKDLLTPPKAEILSPKANAPGFRHTPTACPGVLTKCSRVRPMIVMPLLLSFDNRSGSMAMCPSVSQRQQSVWGSRVSGCFR